MHSPTTSLIGYAVIAQGFASEKRAKVALSNYGVDRSALPLLRDALKDEKEGIRIAAASALGSMGRNAAAAAPQLVSALGDKGDGPRRAAISALGEIGYLPAAVAPLSELLHGPDSGHATEALARMGSPGLDAIKRAYYSGNEDTRIAILSGIPNGGRDTLSLFFRLFSKACG